MDAQRWNAILSRIARHAITDIDDIAAALDDQPIRAGRDVFPLVPAVLMPQAKMKRPDAICIGLRTTNELSDAEDHAMRLAALAIERDVEVIVLAHADVSGLEPFGFRVERIVGDNQAARDACEDQVRRFWNIELIL